MVNMKDGMNLCEQSVKRLFDIVAALIGLILLSPVFFLIAFLVWRRRDGSVFLDRNGSVFRVSLLIF